MAAKPRRGSGAAARPRTTACSLELHPGVFEKVRKREVAVELIGCHTTIFDAIGWYETASEGILV
jgi:hypothetical protein